MFIERNLSIQRREKIRARTRERTLSLSLSPPLFFDYNLKGGNFSFFSPALYLHLSYLSTHTHCSTNDRISQIEIR